MRALILGASGMLGRAVSRVLAAGRDIEIATTQRTHPREADFLDAESPNAETGLDDLLDRVAPRYIVNCAGVLKAEIESGDERAGIRALRVNALFPRLLAAAASARGIPVIHMSTDGVFSGARGRAYVESDATDALDAYGKTKALGEAAATTVVNVRCSILGRDPVHGRGLLEWLLHAPDGSIISGFADQNWNGVTTLQFAEWCGAVIRHRLFDEIRREGPVVHLCPNAATTKYELLNLWCEITGKQVAVRAVPSGQPGRLLASERTAWQQACPLSPGWRQLLQDIFDFEETL
jgi:dTDP-4-dehydrorhamnose reductase